MDRNSFSLLSRELKERWMLVYSFCLMMHAAYKQDMKSPQAEKTAWEMYNLIKYSYIELEVGSPVYFPILFVHMGEASSFLINLHNPKLS